MPVLTMGVRSIRWVGYLPSVSLSRSLPLFLSHSPSSCVSLPLPYVENRGQSPSATYDSTVDLGSEDSQPNFPLHPLPLLFTSGCRSVLAHMQQSVNRRAFSSSTWDHKTNTSGRSMDSFGAVPECSSTTGSALLRLVVIIGVTMDFVAGHLRLKYALASSVVPSVIACKYSTTGRTVCSSTKLRQINLEKEWE